MDGDRVRRSRSWRRDPAIANQFWTYEGIGWPRSFAAIRLWVPGAVIIVALAIWGYVSIGPNGRIVPGHTELHRTDFTVFTEAGAAFFDGRNPYRVTNPRGWHYLYPPLFALLVAPLSVFDTESQVVVWFVVNVGLAFGCFGEVRKLYRLVCRGEPRGFPWIAGCALLAAVPSVLDCMQSGQLGIAILYLLMLGFRLVVQDRSRSRWFLGGVVLALPAVVKLVPALPVAFVILLGWWVAAQPGSGVRRWARATRLTAGVATGVVVFALVIPASLIGWRANLGYLGHWHSQIVTNERVGPHANFNIHSYRNQSLANACYLWEKATNRVLRLDSQSKSSQDRPERIAHPAVRAVIGLLVAMLLVVGCSLASERDPLGLATAYGLACCATLLVSPLSWGHYYMAQCRQSCLCPSGSRDAGGPCKPESSP